MKEQLSQSQVQNSMEIEEEFFRCHYPGNSQTEISYLDYVQILKDSTRSVKTIKAERKFLSYNQQFQDMRKRYKERQYEQVINIGNNALDSFKKQCENADNEDFKICLSVLNTDIAKIQSLMAVAELKKIITKSHKDRECYQNVVKHLQDRYQFFESQYRKAQRKNNLACYEMLNKRFLSAFKHILQIYHVYRTEQSMNKHGLFKNLGYIYFNMQMYQESANCYQFAMIGSKKTILQSETLYLATCNLISLNKLWEQKENEISKELQSSMLTNFNQIVNILMNDSKNTTILWAVLKKEMIRFRVNWTQCKVSKKDNDDNQREIDKLIQEIKIMLQLADCKKKKYFEIIMFESVYLAKQIIFSKRNGKTQIKNIVDMYKNRIAQYKY